MRCRRGSGGPSNLWNGDFFISLTLQEKLSKKKFTFIVDLFEIYSRSFIFWKSLKLDNIPRQGGGQVCFGPSYFDRGLLWMLWKNARRRQKKFGVLFFKKLTVFGKMFEKLTKKSRRSRGLFHLLSRKPPPKKNWRRSMLDIHSAKDKRKYVSIFQVWGSTPASPTPSIFRVVLVHTELKVWRLFDF